MGAKAGRQRYSNAVIKGRSFPAATDCTSLQQDAKQPGLKQEASAVYHLAVISPRTDVTTAARCTSGGTLALPQAPVAQNIPNAGHLSSGACRVQPLLQQRGEAWSQPELRTGNDGTAVMDWV